MAETQDQADVGITIKHNKDGWIYLLEATIPEEEALIYKCGGCGDLLKIIPVTLVLPVSDSNEISDTPQLVLPPELSDIPISVHQQVKLPEGSRLPKAKRSPSKPPASD